VLENGYIESPLGRRRRFPELPYVRGDSYKLAEVFREAINMPSQSAASDVTLSAMIALDKIGLRPRLTVHDSITICVPRAEMQDAAQEMKRCMEQAATDLYGDQIPYPVELEAGERWGSMHALEG
jgi:DNA polymerase I-like protein with 3'-5' exonuclease and polymerase domains